MPASFSREGPLRNQYLPVWTISNSVICLISSLFCHSNMIIKLLIHTISLNLPRNERTETQKPTAFALSVQVCLPFCYGVMLMSETSACVFWSCILFTVSYNWFILGVLACFVLALLWYFLFFFWGLLIFFIKSVKTGLRLLSVTLPLHNSSSGSVTSTDVCERERERSLEVRSVRSARKAKSTQPRKQNADLLPAAMLFIYQQEKSQTP